jgi:EmrB/QacA subfamily drug resistance transporter
VARVSITKASLADAESIGIPVSIFKRRWLILTTLCGSLFAVMIANGGMNLALPAIATDLELGTLKLTWVVEAYSLLFAALLFTTAAVGDRYGREMIMQVGLALFIISSLYAGFVAATGAGLILSRAVMGIGGAMVMPTTLSVINVIFPPQERPRAIAIWTAIAGVGMMIGSVIGGVLLDHLGWESTFWLGAAVAIIMLVCNQFLVAESRDERQRPVDWLGGCFSTIALLGLVYAIMEAPTRGLDDRWVLLGLSAGCAALVAFILWQRKTTHPMLDVHLFRQRAFSVSALVLTITIFALLGVFFSISQLFMLVMGYGALKTSLVMVPMMLPLLILAQVAPVLAAKIGSRWTVVFGCVLVVASFLTMLRWPTVPSYWTIYTGIAIMVGGLAFAMTPATSMMMSAVPRSRSGMGSAMNDTARELGGALGIAVLGALLSSGFADKIAPALSALPEQGRALAEKSLAGALVVAGQLGDAGSDLAYAARAAWMDSLKFSMVIAAVICSGAAIIAAIWMPHREKWMVSDSPELDDGSLAGDQGEATPEPAPTITAVVPSAAVSSD